MYYAAIGVLAIIIHVIMNHEFFRNREEKTETNKAFNKFIRAALAYYVTDSIWGILYEMHMSYALYLDTLLYYLTMAFSVVLLCRYVTTYLNLESGFGRFINSFGKFFAVLEIVTLVINHFIPIFFRIDSEGVYHAGPVRYAALFMQVFLCVLLALQTHNIAGKAAGEMKKRYFTIFMFCVEMTTAIILQIVYPLLPLYSVGMLIGIVIIHTFVKESERESQYNVLLSMTKKSLTDELTGAYNRRAYEDDILNYPDIPVEQDFVYAAVDINGLKAVNDELGHNAGDELIKGAAGCLKRTLGNYGKVYRTGGDEFAVMFFADEEHLKAVASDLDRTIVDWKGSLVPALSMSVGYVTKREFENETVYEMAKIADRRMYKAKSEYYSRKGIDRRKQAAAQTALCNLYTKILKINITDDTYSIVNMDISEQTDEKGFTDTISGWFKGFGRSGQVHIADLEIYQKKTELEYLRDYFHSGKTSINISYRRRYGDIFKDAAMEMIPADDYSDDNQTLFLYVKNIDR